MHDLGGLVWIIIVAIAVISSMRRNVQRARAARYAQTQKMQQVQPPPPPVAAPLQPAVQIAPAPPPPPPVFAAPPPVLPPVIAPPAPPPAQPATFPIAAPVGTSPIRGMFGGSATVVRAIVASQVLGPPISMQEHTIWSPRHSEPSI